MSGSAEATATDATEPTLITGSKAGITAAAMVAALMATIDISIVNVALSDIRASFGTPLDQIGWVSTGYMMANIVVIPMTGWLQRRFGFRRYFTVSILIFTLASILCGLAWSLPSLVAFRILQGIGGGAIIPTAQSILLGRYPRAEHGTASGLFGIGAVAGPLLGPTIGGYLINAASWHWIFWVNIPVGLAAAFLAYRHIEEPAVESGAATAAVPIDLFGIGLLIVGMASTQYVLEEGNREGWTNPHILVLAAVAVIAIVTFVIHELETPHPVVDLRVFKNRSYAAGTGINFLFGTALFGGTFLFSLYAGTVMRYTALDTGHIFLVAGGMQVVLMALVGRFSGKLDGRYLLAAGVMGVAVSLLMTGHLTQQSGFWDLARPQLVRAASMTLIFIPLSMIALSDLPAQMRGNAAGLFNLTRELGGSIGTAWMGMMLTDQTRLHAARMSEHVSLYSQTTQEQLGLFQRTLGSLESAYTVLQVRVQTQALIRAFGDGFVQSAMVILLALGLILLLKRADPTVKVEGAH